jgi:hypothetical protein
MFWSIIHFELILFNFWLWNILEKTEEYNNLICTHQFITNDLAVLYYLFLISASHLLWMNDDNVIMVLFEVKFVYTEACDS